MLTKKQYERLQTLAVYLKRTPYKPVQTEIAKEMKVTPQAVYSLLLKLQQEGAVDLGDDGSIVITHKDFK